MAIHRNRLVAQLSRQDRQQMLAIGQSDQLVSGSVLCEPGDTLGAVYFPTNCTVSVSALAGGAARLGLTLVGREGMLGTSLLLGSRSSSLRTVVQTSGEALRIDATQFSDALDRSHTLQRSLLAHVPLVIAKIATTPACARFHTMERRLAYWLLMFRDRCEAPSFDMNQESLASLVGVRRVSITHAALELRRRGLIEYHRGHVVVLDDVGLETAACECYAADRTLMKDLKGLDRRPTTSPATIRCRAKVMTPSMPCTCSAEPATSKDRYTRSVA